ncbi:MAG: OmpA family protein [Candidatus Kapabacteria bacterium]|nr:OmpA family protein [Candidatus Kapabacteria bacterium]
MKIIEKSLIYLTIVLFLFSINSSSAQFVGTVVALTGSVLNSVTREPVTAYLIVLDENGKRINATRSNSAENGYYYITSLKPGQKYYITISQPNYFKEKFEIEIANTDKYTEISKDFLITPIQKGIDLPLTISPFELNKSKLRFGSEYLLTDIISTLQNNPEIKVDIICFPDNNNDKNENQKLTEERAKSLRTFLIEKGISESRINIKSNSSTDPKNPPPVEKRAKGKRYIGSTYIRVSDF